MNVDFLHNIYGNSLYENEKNIQFWETYLHDLEALDLNLFAEKLTVPILVPIGSKILFRGELKHTNEVTVALGADYFTKCSINQADILKKRRIEEAKSKLDELRKERDYLQNQLSLSKQTYNETGCDIIEVETEEEDKNWRKQHRENVRKYKQNKCNDDGAPGIEVSNEELWNRLEELELQEELQNELDKDVSKHNSMIDSNDTDSDDSESIKEICHSDDTKNHDKTISKENEMFSAHDHSKRSIFQQPSKFELFEQVVERHNVLKKMVAELKARQKACETEDDLIEKVNDMEKLEELEDEIAILEDMLASDEDNDIEESEENNTDSQQKKSVAFADNDDCDTFELTFKHSQVEPSREPYDPQRGIMKPSDIHKAFPEFYNRETTSILKKPKCVSYSELSLTKPIEEEIQEKVERYQDSNLNGPIVVRDVVEKVDSNDKNANRYERPMSLFKKRRQQAKE